MKSRVKSIMKHLAYRSGLLGIYHCLRNRNHLTVVMFHRILPTSDPRYRGADPEWTMTPEAFAHCLNFFQRHYRVVCPDEVFSTLRGETKLPDRSLLITFDDGWADTEEYALPVLEKFSMQSLVFVVGRAINRTEPFWEESLYSFLATQPQGFSKLRYALEQRRIHVSALGASEMDEKEIKRIIHELGQIDMPALEAIACSLYEVSNSHAAMLNAAQLAQLVASGHAIGGHGMTHQPLTKVQDIRGELKDAREILSTYLNNKQVDSMSFPHGEYSDEVITQCRSTGYPYLFSSDAYLNIFTSKSHVTAPVGRIHLSERAFMNSSGRFQPALLACWLFQRPSCRLN